MDSADLQNRFKFHPATIQEKANAHASVRMQCLDLADSINNLAPDSREKNLSITALEECMMWANAALARMNTDGSRL